MATTTTTMDRFVSSPSTHSSEIYARNEVPDAAADAVFTPESQGNNTYCASFAGIIDDILYHILDFAYIHGLPDCYSHGDLPEHSPLSFSHVCRRFRMVATAYPRIWTCIHVTPEQPSGYESVIESHIRYSQEQPLDVVFICYTTNPSVDLFSSSENFAAENGLPRYRACWDLLLKQVKRWKNAVIYICPWAASLLDDFPPRDMPLLESIQCYVHWLELPKPVAGLVNSPKLKRFYYMNMLSSMDKQWGLDNLTDLSLQCIEIQVSQLEAVLTACSDTIVSINCNLTLTSNRSFAPLVLPRLEQLEIEDGSASAWATLLPSLDAPRLRHLGMAFEDREWDFADVIQRLGLSFPQVRYLGWRDMSSGVPRVDARFMWAFPALEHVLLYDMAALACLCYLAAYDRPGSPRILSSCAWPFLQTITVRQWDDVEEPLLDYVRHRMALNVPLTALGLVQDKYLSLTASDLKPERFSALGLTVLEVEGPENNADHWDYWRNIPCVFRHRHSPNFLGPCIDVPRFGLSDEASNELS